MNPFAGTRVEGSDFVYFVARIAVAYTLISRLGFVYGLVSYAVLSRLLDLAI